VAYRKVFAATKALAQRGCRQFFNKTCSVFRGNIGAEFDAMLDALGLEFAVVVLGFPKNGRTTIDSIHYVHGKKLEESEFRSDPIHPMGKSNLVEILQSQTQRKVGAVTQSVICQGAGALRGEILALRNQFQYVILDVPDQESLGTIAEAVKDEPVLCGSSALGETLPAAWGVAPTVSAGLAIPYHPGLGILTAAGSLMPQTAAQIEHMKKSGAPALVLDTEALFETEKRQREMERLSNHLSGLLRGGQDAILHTPNQPPAVEAAQRAGARWGLPKTDVSRLVSRTIAEITAGVLSQTGQNRLIVAGGETSDAVCERLGVNGMRIWKEIQTGLPSCISMNAPQRLLVLKSGSFGKLDFFARALEHLRQP
jgi:uncharacterized protein YgbK (DUF1537 family)